MSTLFVANIIIFYIIFSQDSSVGSALDWYSEGPGFKSCFLLMNFQLEKGCGRDSRQYAKIIAF